MSDDEHIIKAGPLKGKRVEMFSNDRVIRLQPEIMRILDLLGHPDALVTDRSSFGDFFSFAWRDADAQAELAAIAQQLAVGPIAYETLLVDVAEKLRGVS